MKKKPCVCGAYSDTYIQYSYKVLYILSKTTPWLVVVEREKPEEY